MEQAGGLVGAVQLLGPIRFRAAIQIDPIAKKTNILVNARS